MIINVHKLDHKWQFITLMLMKKEFLLRIIIAIHMLGIIQIKT